MKGRAGRDPNDNNQHRDGESPCAAQDDRRPARRDPEGIAHYAEKIFRFFMLFEFLRLSFHFDNSLSNAANAVLCDCQSVSDQPAAMWTFAESRLLSVILLLSIYATLSFSPWRGSAHEPYAIWRRISCSEVACALLSTFSRHSGRSALLLEQSGVASRRLFRQQRPPLHQQPRRSVLLCYQPRLLRQHQQSVSG